MNKEQFLEAGAKALARAAMLASPDSNDEEGQLLKAREQLEQLLARGIGVVALSQPEYPALLRHIYEPPPLLYFRGSVDRLSDLPCVAIVGSRNADAIGLKIAREFAAALAAKGNCIVSGLALGIDSAAHRGALDGASNKGATIAVLGNGLGRVYPASNQKLAESIIESGGVLISQFAPEVPPYPSNFLNRNRVIAGLARGVLVVQASLRSGSLVTARYGLEEGREVMAVPGSIYESRFEGCNRLIKSGAYLVQNADDVIDVVPGLSSTTGTVPESPGREHGGSNSPSSGEGDLLLSQLRGVESCAIVDLKLPGKERGQVEALIFELEMAQLVERLPGNRLTLTAAGRSQCRPARGG